MKFIRIKYIALHYILKLICLAKMHRMREGHAGINSRNSLFTHPVKSLNRVHCTHWQHYIEGVIGLLGIGGIDANK